MLQILTIALCLSVPLGYQMVLINFFRILFFCLKCSRNTVYTMFQKVGHI